jgi:hypothetical protein
MSEESTTPDLEQKVRRSVEAYTHGDFEAGRGLEIGRMQSKSANLFHVRECMVTRLVIYLDRDLAFADLGLEE